MNRITFEKLLRGVFLLLVISLASSCASLRPLPIGVSFEGQVHPVEKVRFMRDLTYKTPNGSRKSEQEIFDRWLHIIRGAKRYIVLDIFFFNDTQGPVWEHTRELAKELTEALIAQKRSHPNMRIIVISDPVNTFYGGLRSPHFEALKAAGIEMHLTDLTKLRDSNLSWSIFWRLFVRPLGNDINGKLPTPFVHPKATVSLRSYLAALNLKTNHRKVLIADRGQDLVALVTSFNPADGSSGHSNIALEVTGPAARDLLTSENVVLRFSGARPLILPTPKYSRTRKSASNLSVQVVTESKVRNNFLKTLRSLEEGDRFDLVMYLLADRRVITSLKKAHERGVVIRVLLDPNLREFGFDKPGMPNVPVAYELNNSGLDVRWCEPAGTQCHSKLMLARKRNGEAWLSLGSTNLTRKHLNDFNLETNLVVRGPVKAPVFAEVTDWLDDLWNNRENRTFSKPLEEVKRPNILVTLAYHVMERSGWAFW